MVCRYRSKTNVTYFPESKKQYLVFTDDSFPLELWEISVGIVRKGRPQYNRHNHCRYLEAIYP